MSSTDFNERLARLQKKGAPDGPNGPAGGGPSGGDRKAKLARALFYLDRGGIRGNYAYAPAMRALARRGIIVTPLHYWSWPGLFALFVVIMCLVGAASLGANAAFGPLRGPIRGMIEAGPVVFAGLTTVLAIGFATLHKVQAARIGLPRWRDL